MTEQRQAVIDLLVKHQVLGAREGVDELIKQSGTGLIRFSRPAQLARPLAGGRNEAS